jgi:hypothetical protein
MATVMRVVSESVYQQCMAKSQPSIENTQEGAGPSKPLSTDSVNWSMRGSLDPVISNPKFEFLPKSKWRKGVFILDKLRETGTFSWNYDGNIYYNGILIPASSIAKLILALLSFNPALEYMRGSDEFCKSMLKHKQITRNLSKKMLTFIKKIVKK